MALTLAEEFQDVVVLGTAPMHDHRVRSLVLPELPMHTMGRARRTLLLAARRWKPLLWNADFSALADRIERERFDLISCHELELLPLSEAGRGGAGLLFDAREFFPLHFEDRLSWRVFYRPLNLHLCRAHLPHVDQMMTVSPGLAERYQRDFGVTADVVMGFPAFHELSPSPTPADRIRLIHHGNSVPSRELDVMVEMMDQLDQRFSLDLMLVNTHPEYYRSLERRVSERSNVRLIPPVPYKEIISFINRYDVGVYLCPATSFNLRHALPNKLFEFIQARLAVVIGPSPDMARVVNQYGCGRVAAGFDVGSMTEALAALTQETVEDLKQASSAASRELSAASNRELMLRLADEAMDRRRAP
jgi:glycosyltransferase involved in cell wall biosynthesis